MRYGILGPIEVTDGERKIDLGAPRQRAVLAILLIHANTTVSLDRLIDELWGNEPPGAATASIQAYISYLRKALEPSRAARAGARVLVTQAPGYQLCVEESDVDHLRFERLVQEAHAALANAEPAAALSAVETGLALWRGDALADFAYERFAAVETLRLHELRSVALELRFDALLASGRHSSVVGELERAIVDHPYRERMRAQLITALYRGGRQAEALRAFEHARVLLARELGLEPGPELRELQRAILEHDPRLMPDGGAAPATTREAKRAPHDDPPPVVDPAASQHGTERGAQGDKFVGRRDLLDELRGQLAVAEGGSTRFVLIGGEPGIGKSRLAGEIGRAALDRGWIVAWGRSHDEEGAAPLAPWVNVLRTLAPATLRLDSHVVTSLAALLPEFGDSPAIADGDSALFRLCDAVYQVVCAASARHPALLIFDDVQWADRTTLRLLRYLAAEATNLPAVVVLTFHEPGDFEPGGLGSTIADLERQHHVHRYTLDGLNVTDVRELLDGPVQAASGGSPPAHLDLDRVASSLHARTEGNPLFLTELVRLLRSEHWLTVPATGLDGSASDGLDGRIPTVVDDVVRRRLQRLPDDVQTMLTVAAVLGREFDLAVVQHVTGVNPDRSLEAIEAAIVSSLVTDVGADRFRFTHGLVRETIYRSLSVTRRSRLHAAAARAIESNAGSATIELSDQLAYHYAMGGDAVKECEHTVMAAELAERRLAFDDAVQGWRRALELTAGDGAAARAHQHYRVRIIQALRNGGHPDESLAELTSAVRDAETGGYLPELVDELFDFGEEGLLQLNNYRAVDPSVIASLERCARALPEDAVASTVRVWIMVAVAQYYDAGAGPSSSRAHARRAAELARTVADPVLLGETLTRLLFLDDPSPARERLAADVEELAGAMNLLSEPIRFTANARVARIRLSLGDATHFDEQITALAAETAASRWLSEAVFARWCLTGLHLLRGRLDAAEREASQTFAMHQRLGTWGALEIYGLYMIFIWREQGRLSELAPVVEPMLHEAVHPGAKRMLAIFAADRGDRKGVVELLGSDPVPRALEFTWLCDACVTAELASEAQLPCASELFELLSPYADRVAVMDGTGFCLGSVSYYLGLLASCIGRGDPIALHERGMEINDRIGAAVWSVRSRSALAQVLSISNPVRATILLDEAAVRAAEHGLSAMQQKIAAMG